MMERHPVRAHLDDPSIGNNELVIRRVAHQQQRYDRTLGRSRPSTAAFIQGGADGLTSVYLASETTPESVSRGGSQPYLCAVSVGILRANSFGIIRTPESGGPGHCDITGRKTRGKLAPVVKAAQWVPGYAPPPGADDIP